MLNLIAAMTTCVIVYPTDDPYWKEIRRHEFAHCNGWVHPEGKPHKSDGTQHYKGFQPPREFYTRPYGGYLIEMPMPLEFVREECGAQFRGCQRFEEY